MDFNSVSFVGGINRAVRFESLCVVHYLAPPRCCKSDDIRDVRKIFWELRPWSVSVTDAEGLIMWELHLDGQISPAGRALEA
jgi:hypothetical protein